MAKRKVKPPKKTGKVTSKAAKKAVKKVVAKLTAKQEMFCHEYLIDLNATQAAIRAGYSKKTAYIIGFENLRKPKLSKYITELKTKRIEKATIDAAWVLNKAVALHDSCVEAKDNSNAARSLEIVGKHIDILAFDTTVRHTGPEGGPVEVDLSLRVHWIDPDDKQPPK